MEHKTLKTLEQLESFVKDFAAQLHGGEVIGLVGDLGAGKTTFVQHLATALGVKKAVRSPTFVLMQVYDTDTQAHERGVAMLCHVDAYRLKKDHELEGIGFADYAGRHDVVTVVEWADRVPSLHRLPNYREMTLVIEKNGARKLTW